MTRYTIILLTLSFVCCAQTNSSDTEIHASNLGMNTEELTRIVLTETKLGALELNKLTENNILTKIKSAFPDFQITKTVGQQDGPDFNLYQVTQNKSEIFFISMDSYDTLVVQELWTNNQIIQDEYGIDVGQKIEYALEKRPALKFHSDLHQNIYATAQNSKIEYRLTGHFKTLNDTTFFADDYSVEKWQTEGMEIDYLIWRK